MFFFRFISFGEACHSFHVSRFVVPNYVRRKTINSNLKIVHKKTPKVDIEDLFEDDLFEPDLFSEPVQKVTQNEATTILAKDSSTSTDPKESSSTAKRRVSARSIAFKRTALFNKQIYFVKPQLGVLLKQRPNIRSRTWLTMIQLAKDGEDMKKVLDLIPMFHEGGGALPSRFTEDFVREWYRPSHIFLSKLSHIHKHLIFQVVANNYIANLLP